MLRCFRLFALSAWVLLSADSVAQQPAVWRLVVDRTIGDDRQDATTFADIRGIAVNPAGDVFVLDAATQDIRMFNARGTFVRRVARRGKGPGELSSANGLLGTPDGGFVVNDVENNRIAFWTASGLYARQVMVTNPLRAYVWLSGWDGDTRLVESIMTLSVRDNTRTRALRRISLDGKAVDTLPEPDCLPDGPRSVTFFTGARGAGPGMLVPFAAQQRKAISRTGSLWCTAGVDYRIERFRIGSTLASDTISRPGLVERVTAAEHDSAAAVVRAFRSRWVGGNADPALIPAVKPAIEGLVTDDSDRLWVRRPTSGAHETRYDVWEGRRLIATVESPLRFAREVPIVVVHNTLYGVGVDEDGVQSVIIARIVR